MKNLVVYYDSERSLKTDIQDVTVLSAASLKPNEILIKVTVAGSNPKDYKHPLPAYFNSRINQGDDCAGTVAAIGTAVRGFQVGERVAGFHQMATPHGTYAEYAICPEQVCDTEFIADDLILIQRTDSLPHSGLYQRRGSSYHPARPLHRSRRSV